MSVSGAGGEPSQEHSKPRTLADDLKDGGYQGKTYIPMRENSPISVLIFEENGNSYRPSPQLRDVWLNLGAFQVESLWSRYQINREFQSVVGAFIDFRSEEGDRYKLMVDLSDILDARQKRTYRYFGQPILEPPLSEGSCVRRARTDL